MALYEEYAGGHDGRQGSGARTKEYIGELFDGEEFENFGLDEVVFDHESDQWLITIGFSRPWDRPKSLSAALREDPLMRSYKVVYTNDADGKAVSVKDRVLTAAQ